MSLNTGGILFKSLLSNKSSPFNIPMLSGLADTCTVPTTVRYSASKQQQSLSLPPSLNTAMPFCCLISKTFPSKVQYHQADTDQTQQNDAMLQAQVSSAPLLLFCSSNRTADCTKYFPGRQRCCNPHGQLEGAFHRGSPSTSLMYHQ